VRQLGLSRARRVGPPIAVEMRRDGVPEIPFRINAAESMDDPAGARRMEA
jgi:hypothetical protein